MEQAGKSQSGLWKELAFELGVATAIFAVAALLYVAFVMGDMEMIYKLPGIRYFCG